MSFGLIGSHNDTKEVPPSFDRMDRGAVAVAASTLTKELLVLEGDAGGVVVVPSAAAVE